MKLRPEETELVGKWIMVNGKIQSDATCERIHWLISNYLRKIGISKQWGAWETLFQDPDDRRFWEQTYPQSHMHGGGPPMLRCLSKEQAKEKYGKENL